MQVKNIRVSIFRYFRSHKIDKKRDRIQQICAILAIFFMYVVPNLQTVSHLNQVFINCQQGLLLLIVSLLASLKLLFVLLLSTLLLASPLLLENAGVPAFADVPALAGVSAFVASLLLLETLLTLASSNLLSAVFDVAVVVFSVHCKLQLLWRGGGACPYSW
jgi:hypothetical protein